MSKSQEVFSSLTPITIDYFFEKFSSFENEAFRLEALPIYSVDFEKADFRKFKEDTLRDPPADYNSEWVNIVSKSLKRNALFKRVRVIPVAKNDYFHFELKWAYTVNIKAGEQIRCLDNLAMNSLSHQVPILKDFWLFDNKECLLMEYDLNGEFLGVNKLKNSYVDCYVDFKEELMLKSIDIRSSDIWKELITI